MRRVRVLHISKYYYPFSGGTELVARQCVRALQNVTCQDEYVRLTGEDVQENEFQRKDTGKNDSLQKTGQYVFEQVVFCFDHKGMKGSSVKERSEDSVEVIDGIRVVRCRCEAKVASQSLSFSYRRRLLGIFRRFKPDIVVLHYPNPFGAHYLLSFLEPDQKLVIFWHLDIVKQKALGRLFAGQNHRLLERADRLIPASPNYVEGSPWLRQFREKCVIIPDCIDDARILSLSGSSASSSPSRSKGEKGEGKELSDWIRERFAGKILCLAVGRHVEYKGFRYLIDAARYLDENYVIVITGEGPLTEELKQQAEALRQQAEEVGPKSKEVSTKPDGQRRFPEIVFAGLVSDEELQAYLHACDIFCFPSITKNEAFGIALAEGMYCGKPAVTFTIEGSGVNYVSLGGVTGIECPNRDSQAYADAIRLLAENSELREQYGQAAKKRVEEHFLYKQFAERIRNLFMEVACSLSQR